MTGARRAHSFAKYASLGVFGTVLELHHRQSVNVPKVAEVAGSYGIAEFQSRYSNQQVGKWKPNSLSLVLTIDLADTKSDWHRDRVDGQCHEEFSDERQARRFTLCGVSTGCAVG